MEFYYNSGLPQRQRRSGRQLLFSWLNIVVARLLHSEVKSFLPSKPCRDSRPNALNKDVPSFLLYPDGSHLLGVISPAANRAEEDAGSAFILCCYKLGLTKISQEIKILP